MIDRMQFDNEPKNRSLAGAADPRYHESTVIQVFNLPSELLFKALTEAEHIAQWWKPEGHHIIESSLDLCPGGLFHYHMQSPLGERFWGRFVFKEIIASQKLVFIQSFCDEYGGIRCHPASHNWPREVLHVLTLEEYNGKTILTLNASPVNTSGKEARTFLYDTEIFQHSLSGCFDQMKEYLSGFFRLTIHFFHNGKEYTSYCRQGVETAGVHSLLKGN